MATFERRREPRVQTDLPGVLHADQDFHCQVADLSRNGALAIANRALPEHAIVRIRLETTSPAGNPATFECEAAVVRCHPRPDGHFDLGLYFLSITESHRRVLESIIATHGLAPKS
jgi:c-di-GMP-binding flagellar brake protein YcgR